MKHLIAALATCAVVISTYGIGSASAATSGSAFGHRFAHHASLPSLPPPPPCTISWTGTSGTGLWTDGGNWDLGRAPGILDVVCIESGTMTPVVLKGGGDPVKVAALEISGMGHSLTIDSPDSLTISGMFGPSIVSSVVIGGSLVNEAPSALLLTGTGVITDSPPAAPGILSNFGTLQLDSAMCVSWGATLYNAGSLLLASDDMIWNCASGTGTLSNAPSGTISKTLSTGGASSIDLSFNNSGTVKSLAGELEITGSGTDTSALYTTSASGSVEFPTGTVRTFADGSNRIAGTGVVLDGAVLKGLDADDTLNIIGTLTWISGAFSGPGALSVAGFLKVTGSGTLGATLPVTNTGSLSVVTSGATVSLSGALSDPGKLTLCPTCELDVASLSLKKSSVTTLDIASTGAGAVTSGGTAALAGAIDAVDTGGFKPPKGKAFTILAAKTVSGRFADGTSNGYVLSYSSTGARLVAA